MKNKTNHTKSNNKMESISSYQIQESSQQQLDASKLKQFIIPISILVILGSWINLCHSMNNIFLSEALTCSAIIVAILFFESAGQCRN